MENDGKFFLTAGEEENYRNGIERLARAIKRVEEESITEEDKNRAEEHIETMFKINYVDPKEGK